MSIFNIESDYSDNENEQSFSRGSSPFLPTSIESEIENEAEFNNELFLKHVCNYPAIYNSQCKGYSNRNQKLRAWENIAKSMGATVEFCTKRWKSLREKYHREKQKQNNLFRSGAAAASTPKWQYMSFFEFMYDKVKPRQTSSSILAENIKSKPVTSTSPNFLDSLLNTPQSQRTIEDPKEHATKSRVLAKTTLIPHSTTSKGIKRKSEKEDPVVGVLEQIGNALQTNTTTLSDKVNDFSKYLAAEIRDLPCSEQNEFMDETLIRLLQVKRKNKKNNHQ